MTPARADLQSVRYIIATPIANRRERGKSYCKTTLSGKCFAARKHQAI